MLTYYTMLSYAQEGKQKLLDLHVPYKMGARDVFKATLFIIYIVSAEGWLVHNDYLGGKKE